MKSSQSLNQDKNRKKALRCCLLAASQFDEMRKMLVINKTFDEERSLYNIKNSTVKNCVFAGEADGESVLKECRDIEVDGCSFSLRYPLWHAKGYVLKNSSMDELTRAPIWYSENGIIENCNITGIKCLRECDNTVIKGSTISSEEFGWRCRTVKVENTSLQSQYLFFECRDVSLNNVNMKGKYSFQYIDGLNIKNSFLDTKDAFWHSKNVTVENTTLKGEYLAWFSENLTLINCHISGTQPLCYCKGLKLINCTMEGTDLSFEYSEVKADVKGNIMSVKNPKSGYINADSIGDIIYEDSIMESDCKITTKS